MDDNSSSVHLHLMATRLTVTDTASSELSSEPAFGPLDGGAHSASSELSSESAFGPLDGDAHSTSAAMSSEPVFGLLGGGADSACTAMSSEPAVGPLDGGAHSASAAMSSELAVGLLDGGADSASSSEMSVSALKSVQTMSALDTHILKTNLIWYCSFSVVKADINGLHRCCTQCKNNVMKTQH